jgi:hypothetical protein
MLSLATADCGWLVLTTAVPSGARDSRLRVNHRQNRRAGDEREGKCSNNGEPLHACTPRRLCRRPQECVSPSSSNGECDVQHNISLHQLFVAAARLVSDASSALPGGGRPARSAPGGVWRGDVCSDPPRLVGGVTSIPERTARTELSFGLRPLRSSSEPDRCTGSLFAARRFCTRHKKVPLQHQASLYHEGHP